MIRTVVYSMQRWADNTLLSAVWLLPPCRFMVSTSCVVVYSTQRRVDSTSFRQIVITTLLLCATLLLYSLDDSRSYLFYSVSSEWYFFCCRALYFQVLYGHLAISCNSTVVWSRCLA
jgi:hypothetical protein